MSISAPLDGPCRTLKFHFAPRPPSLRAGLERAFELADWSAQGELVTEATQRLCAVQGLERALLTASGSSALELAALQLGIEPGDNVIVPSYAFPACATAFTRAGAEVRFADIDVRSGCLSIESAARMIDARTRAAVVIHYGGRCWRLDALSRLCQSAGIALVEDCAHALGSTYHGRSAGDFGRFSAFSFHHTKNVSCGEGGALGFGAADASAILRTYWSGTDREAFLKGEVAAYTWVAEGSSFGPSQFQAALLLDQLERLDALQAARWAAWSRYRDGFAALGSPEIASISEAEDGCRHSAHIFYLRLSDKALLAPLEKSLNEDGIPVRTHYQPLHRAERARALRCKADDCEVSSLFAQTLLRLPIHSALSLDDVDWVISRVARHLKASGVVARSRASRAPRRRGATGGDEQVLPRGAKASAAALV